MELEHTTNCPNCEEELTLTLSLEQTEETEQPGQPQHEEKQPETDPTTGLPIVKF